MRKLLPPSPNGSPTTPGLYVVETDRGEVFLVELEKSRTPWTFGRAISNVVRYTAVSLKAVP